MIEPNHDDIRYIRAVTRRIPDAVKNELHTAYKQAWQDAYGLEHMEHKKENAGRFAANTLIRKLARNYMETGNTGIPRICGNCDKCESWQGQYYCKQFKQEIPAEYINKENDCEQYENAIPF